MFVDLLGQKRLKINLHMHTDRTDGHVSPEEAVARYGAMGYDAVALTDHWVYGDADRVSGVQIIPGCEYNIGGADGSDPVFHILGVGARENPRINRDALPTDIYGQAAVIISKIREAGGLAVLAHPAWSLNTPEMLARIEGLFDAAEIYNSVSDWGMSDRAYSDLIVDQIATMGIYVPLLATDDAHYYDGDEGRGFIAVEEEAFNKMGLAGAVKSNRFYASMGPEIHLSRLDDGSFRVVTSPVCKIEFMSNYVWTAGRIIRGDNLTSAVYRPKNGERYVRAVAIDSAGKMAWSPIIPL